MTPANSCCIPDNVIAVREAKEVPFSRNMGLQILPSCWPEVGLGWGVGRESGKGSAEQGGGLCVLTVSPGQVARAGVDGGGPCLCERGRPRWRPPHAPPHPRALPIYLPGIHSSSETTQCLLRHWLSRSVAVGFSCSRPLPPPTHRVLQWGPTRARGLGGIDCFTQAQPKMEFNAEREAQWYTYASTSQP